MNSHQFLSGLRDLFGAEWPKELRMLYAVSRLQDGASAKEIAEEIRSTPGHVAKLGHLADPVASLRGEAPDAVEKSHRKARQTLGNLTVGECAELVFEAAYKRELHTDELELRDLRESRSDTDYRLYNGNKRPLYRINIKFHGSRFRRAPEMVGLEPSDCFALATYKIYGALKKQVAEGLPYIFAIVGVEDLPAEAVGAAYPQSDLDLLAAVYQSPKIGGKYSIEEALVRRARASGYPVYAATFERIAEADWYLLSARRAYQLMLDKLFDRVFALRVRGFAQQWRGAELDMHFSLTQDLTPLSRYFDLVRQDGQVRVATLLERGEL